MVIVMPPVAMVLNYLLFGKQYFFDARTFVPATLLSLCVLVLVYVSCGMVASVLLNRFLNTIKRLKGLALACLPIY